MSATHTAIHQVCSWYQQLGQNSKLGMPKTSTSQVTSLLNTQPTVLKLCKHGPGGTVTCCQYGLVYAPCTACTLVTLGPTCLVGPCALSAKRSDLAETLHAAAHGSTPHDATGDWAHSKCVPCRLTSTQLSLATHNQSTSACYRQPTAHYERSAFTADRCTWSADMVCWQPSDGQPCRQC